MIRLFRWRWAACCALCVLNVAHVLVHGTPLDNGALDAAIQQLNVLFITTNHHDA